MYAFKIVTTTLNILIMVIILWFMSSLDWKKHKSSIIGFSFMQIVYLMNMFCMWR